MSKRNRVRYQPEEAPQDTEENETPTEDAFIVKKLSLSEWQIVDVRIRGDEVIFRKEREPDVAAIVSSKLMQEIARKE